jgi:N-acetylmuramoyl-L-alanine amidase
MAALIGILLWHFHRPKTVPISHVPPPPAAANRGPLWDDPPGILIHHSDTPAKSRNGELFDATVLDRIAKKRGFSVTYQGKVYHISYHYVILPDGTVQTGRPEKCHGAHCPHFNNWLGICLIGDFQNQTRWLPNQPTEKQKQALVTLCESLMSKYSIPPENVRRHRDVHMTYCPGSQFPYGEIIAQLRTYASVHPETRLPHPPPPGVIASSTGTAAKKAEQREDKMTTE